MTPKDLIKEYRDKTGEKPTNSQGEPDIDYVIWLQDKVITLSAYTETLKQLALELTEKIKQL